MNPFIPMHTVLKPGTQGSFKLDHFEIGEPSTRMLIKPGEYIPRGKYVRLTVNSYNTVMSDTPEEHRSNWDVVNKAKGDVLIAGLGIGMVLLPILRKPEVKRVLVLEKFVEVEQLVYGQIRAVLTKAQRDKMALLNTDALEWVPSTNQKWDTIYFDIWNDITTDNLKDITKLKRRFCRRLNPGGWMGAWVEDRLRYQLRREKRMGW